MKTPLRGHKSAAFTLIEVTLALGIVAFCLIPLLGMLPIGMNMDRTASEQTTANAILSAVAADLRATPQQVPIGAAIKTSRFAISIPANSDLTPPAATPSASPPPPTPLYFSVEGECASSGSTTFADSTNTPHYLLTVQFCNNPAPPNDTAGVKGATFAILEVSWPSAVPLAQATGKVQMFVALNRN